MYNTGPEEVGMKIEKKKRKEDDKKMRMENRWKEKHGNQFTPCY